jgi:outer membrane protein TolC
MHFTATLVVALLSQTGTPLDAKLRAMFVESGLTADDVAKRSMSSSRDLEARQAALDAADSQLTVARAGFIPRVTGGVSYTRLSEITPPVLGLGDDGRFLVTTGPAGPLGGRQIFAAGDISFPVYLDNGVLRAGLVVPLSDYLLRTIQQVQSAEQSRVAAQVDARVAKLKAANDGRLAYFAWVRARGQQLVARQTLEQSRSRAADISHAFDVGSASRADVLRGESLVEQARLLLARTDNLAGVTEQQVRLVIRAQGNEPLGIAGRDFDSLAESAPTDDFEALVARAAHARLELKSLDAARLALEAQRRSGWAAVFPRVDASGNVLYANPNQRYIPNDGKWHFTWDVGVGLSWQPSDIPAALATINATDARARATRAQLSAVEEVLRVEVKQAVLALEEARIALESTKQAQVSAEEGYRVRQELFTNGRSTTVEVIDAETELTRARLEALNAQIDARIARVRFQHAVGDDVARDAPEAN